MSDNNASIIVLPSYWQNDELSILIRNIKLITELINSQIIFTYTLGGLIEEFFLNDGSLVKNNGFTFAAQLKKLLLVLEKTSSQSRRN